MPMSTAEGGSIRSLFRPPDPAGQRGLATINKPHESNSGCGALCHQGPTPLSAATLCWTCLGVGRVEQLWSLAARVPILLVF